MDGAPALDIIFFYPLQCQNVTTGELPGDAGWDASSNRFLLKYRGFSGL